MVGGLAVATTSSMEGERKFIMSQSPSVDSFFLAYGFLEALIIWIFFYLGTVSMKNFHLSLLSIRTCGPLVPRAKVVPVQWKLFPAKSMIEDDRKKSCLWRGYTSSYKQNGKMKVIQMSRSKWWCLNKNYPNYLQLSDCCADTTLCIENLIPYTFFL